MRFITRNALRTKHGMAGSAPRVIYTHFLQFLQYLDTQPELLHGRMYFASRHSTMLPGMTCSGLCGIRVKGAFEFLEQANERETSGSNHAGRESPDEGL